MILQTRDENHPIFRHIGNHDYYGFYRAELEQRRMLMYPPFSRLARLLVRGDSEKAVTGGIEQVKAELLRAISEIDRSVVLLGRPRRPSRRSAIIIVIM